MAYKNGTYVAFDGLGTTDPTKSDFQKRSSIQAWSDNNNIDFKFVNSHDKTNAVRDTSLKSTLKARINERLSNSKNAIIILSSKTRKSGSMLSFEIEQAVDYYEIPLIVVYVDYSTPIRNVNALSSYWPNALETRINNNSAKAIHVPFKKSPFLAAVGQFSVNGNSPKGGAKGIYSDDAYKNWELF